jgi:hypothetical protein
MRPPPINPSKAAQQRMVSAWNHPEGTAVIVTKDRGEEVHTITRSGAWMQGGHTAVILLAGISGSYALQRVRVAPPVAIVEWHDAGVVMAEGEHSAEAFIAALAAHNVREYAIPVALAIEDGARPDEVKYATWWKWDTPPEGFSSYFERCPTSRAGEVGQAVRVTYIDY